LTGFFYAAGFGGRLKTKRITIQLSAVDYSLLQVLTCGEYAPQSVEEVVDKLLDHVRQGVYRPGAWERGWLCQAFGDDWTEYLEPGDPYGRANCESIFQRPKRPSSRRRPE
jgi:hypothetical protein